MSELKSCPFCGLDDIYDCDDNVTCGACGATATNTVRWNSRPAPPDSEHCPTCGVPLAGTNAEVNLVESKMRAEENEALRIEIERLRISLDFDAARG